MGNRGFVFTEATREKLKLRMAITGVTGGGKTWTAIALATYLLGGTLRDPSMVKRLAVIDTERGTARRYARGRPFYFSHLELKSFEPEAFVDAIRAAHDQGFDAIVIDSLSHEWAGTGGALEQVDKAAKNGNTFVAWGSVTPRHNAVIDAIMGSPVHVIATMRAKMAHEQGVDEKGKKVVKKLGLAAVQREGIEYEFDVIMDMDLSNCGTITKSRCSDLNGRDFREPGQDLADIIGAWLEDGEDAEALPEPLPPVRNAPARPAAPKPDAAIVDPLLLRLKGADNEAIRAVWDEADAAEGITPTGRAFVRAAAIGQWTAIAETIAHCDGIAKLIKEQGFPAAAERRLLDALNVKAKSLPGEDGGEPADE